MSLWLVSARKRMPAECAWNDLFESEWQSLSVGSSSLSSQVPTLPSFHGGRWTIAASSVTLDSMFVPRRLDKYLRDSTALSVVEIRRACLAGRVSVGAVCATADSLIFEDDVVMLDGSCVIPVLQHRYLIWNKPPCVTVTTNDPEGRTDLGPWLRKMPRGVFPVGRLDRGTTGALLFTDDGDFANAILQPEHHTEKLYWLWLDEHLPDDDPRLRAMVDGVPSGTDFPPLRATSARVLHRTWDYTELLVTLDEGKNRHIRKMCNLLRLRLLQLHRKAIGSLQIDDLAPGHWRELRPEEIERVWTCSGGKSHVLRNKITALTAMAKSARNCGRSLERLETWLQAAVARVDTSPP